MYVKLLFMIFSAAAFASIYAADVFIDFWKVVSFWVTNISRVNGMRLWVWERLPEFFLSIDFGNLLPLRVWVVLEVLLVTEFRDVITGMIIGAKFGFM